MGQKTFVPTAVHFERNVLSVLRDDKAGVALLRTMETLRVSKLSVRHGEWLSLTMSPLFAQRIASFVERTRK